MTKTTTNTPLEQARQNKATAEQGLIDLLSEFDDLQASKEQTAESIRSTGTTPTGPTLAQLGNSIIETELKISGQQARLDQANELVADALADEVEATVREQIKPLRSTEQESPHVAAIAAAVTALLAETQESNEILDHIVKQMRQLGDTFERDKWNPKPHTDRVWLLPQDSSGLTMALCVDGVGTFKRERPTAVAEEVLNQVLRSLNVLDRAVELRDYR